MKNVKISSSLSLIILFSFLWLPFNANAEDYKTIAILPFDINAPDDIYGMRMGIESMLYSRLYRKDKVLVFDSQNIEQKIKKLNFQNRHIMPEQMAVLLKLDYVITGYITFFSNAFSIDIRVYDRHKQQWMTFFEQSSSTDFLIQKVNIVSAKINKTLFNHESVVYDKLVRKEKEKAEKWKLQNPMEMASTVPEEEKSKKKSSFWRFWE